MSKKPKESRDPKKPNKPNEPNKRSSSKENAKNLLQAARLIQKRQNLTEKISSLQMRLLQSNRTLELLLQTGGGNPYAISPTHWTAQTSTTKRRPPIEKGKDRPNEIYSVPAEAQLYLETRGSIPKISKYQKTTVSGSKRKQLRNPKIGKLKKGRRGRVKARILRLLSKSEPMRVKDIAKAIHKNQGDVFTWFAITGKTTPGIKKVSRGTYSFDPKKLLTIT
jgi:hypothetical protein